MNWINNNKNWLFSGIGIVLLSQAYKKIEEFLTEEVITWMNNNLILIILSLIILALSLVIFLILRRAKIQSNHEQKNENFVDTILNYEPNYSIEELINRLSIIVIDDDQTFPTKGFIEYGYRIKELKKLKSENDLKDLLDNKYDIIILDYYDIALDLSDEDGIGILKSIKENNPAQLVIAYSNQQFDISKAIFWDLSDDKLGKPTPFVSTEGKLRKLIDQKFTVKFFYNKFCSTLKECKESHQLQQIEVVLVEAIKNKKAPNYNVEFNFIPSDGNCRVKVVNISKSLLKLLNIK